MKRLILNPTVALLTVALVAILCALVASILSGCASQHGPLYEARQRYEGQSIEQLTEHCEDLQQQ